MDAQELQRVAVWATTVKPSDLPEASVASARRIFLDDVSGIVAGHLDGEVRALVRGWPLTPGSASVLGPGAVTAHPWSAAEVNAIAGCWLEVDGGFRLNTAHAGLYTISTVMALAEAEGLSLGEAFTAMTVGYEVAARIVTRWDVAAANSHAHGSVAAAAAAAAAGYALGLDVDQWLAAVTSAATMSVAAPFGHAFAGAVVRNLWAAHGNRAGQVAVHAALRGVSGLPTSIEDTYRDVFQAPRWEGAQLSATLGSAVEFAYQKNYACCAYLHSTVEATITLLDEEVFDVDQIIGITNRIHPVGLPLNDPSPATTLGARFSAPHAIAATLVRGSAAPTSFGADTLEDEAIAALRRSVRMVEMDQPGRDARLRDGEVELHLQDGRQLRRYVATAIGDPTRPLSNEQLIDKAAGLTGRDVQPLATAILESDMATPFRDVSALIRQLIA